MHQRIYMENLDRTRIACVRVCCAPSMPLMGSAIAMRIGTRKGKGCVTRHIDSD